MGSLFFFESKITGFRHYFDMDSPYPIAMTTDKVFILLLVILLPITGCLDMTDNAEAEGSDEETTVINNYYNNTTEVSMLPAVYSLHIEQGTPATFDFDGNETWKVESITVLFDAGAQGNDGSTGSYGTFDMNCSGSLLVDNGRLQTGYYLPVLGGESCSVEFSATPFMDYILTFSKANLESIR